VTVRRAALAIGVLSVLVAGAGAAYVTVLAPSSKPPSASSPASTPTPTTTQPPPALAALTDRGQPSPRLLAKLLAKPAAAAALGDRLIGEVEDVRTGKVLWRHDAAGESPPASTTKLLTATAALTTLGPNARLETSTVRRKNTLWLVGGGDVTLAKTSPKSAYPRPATITSLASRTASVLEAAGVAKVRLDYDTSAETGPELAPGWSPTYFTEGDIAPPSALELDEGRTAPNQISRVSDPSQQAAEVFATDLSRDGVTVIGEPAHVTAPAGARPVARVQSPTIAQLVQQMLTNSDDDLAEALGRAIARKDGLPPTFANAAKGILAADRAAGIDLAGVTLVDASGLSHADRMRPAALLDVLRLAAQGDKALAPILEGLPVAGFSGTLATRYRTAATRGGAGVVRAKTGTLTGVSALAGLVADRSGDLLAFALLAPEAPSAEVTEPALDRIATELAGCGCGREAGPGA